MNKRLSNQLLICIVVFIGTCAQSALALYNPIPGRWLSRDPLEPNTSTPYAYVSGNPIDAYDAFGLVTCTVNIIENVDPSDMPKVPPNNIVADAVTACGHRITAPKSRCGGGCTASGVLIRSVQISCECIIKFKRGASRTARVANPNSNRTLEGHERWHVYHRELHLTEMERALKAMLRKCVSESCMDAFETYLDALEEYQYGTEAWRDAALDCQDYIGDAQQVACESARTLHSQLSPLFQATSTAHDVMRGKCPGR